MLQLHLFVKYFIMLYLILILLGLIFRIDFYFNLLNICIFYLIKGQLEHDLSFLIDLILLYLKILTVSILLLMNRLQFLHYLVVDIFRHLGETTLVLFSYLIHHLF